MKQTRARLKNGIHLIHYHLPATNSVTICVMFNVGSYNEIKNEYGMAHFLEHMIFEGSKNYPDISETHFLLESLGIIENAWTFKNLTNYWMKSPKENFSKAVEILFDRVFNPLLREDFIPKQKGIILEEIKMGKDDPWRSAWDNTSENLFKGSRLAHPTIGYKKTVSKFTHTKIANFYKRNYTKDNLTVWVGGNISAQKAQNILSKMKLPNRKLKRYKKPYRNTSSNTTVFKKMDINTNYLILGINGFDINDIDIDRMLIYNTILGEGKGSLLNNELRVKKSIVSIVESALDSYIKDGLLYLYLITDRAKLLKALSIALSQIKKIAYGDYTNNMLTRAKNIVKAQFINLQESSESFGYTHSLLNLMRRELLTKKEIDFDKVLEIIENTSKKDISKTFQKIVKNSKIVASITGPDPKVKDSIKKLIKEFKI